MHPVSRALLVTALVACAVPVAAASEPVAPRAPEQAAVTAVTAPTIETVTSSTTPIQSITMADSTKGTTSEVTDIRVFNETIPGGYFLGADKKPHNANGEPVETVSAETLQKAGTDAPAVTSGEAAATTDSATTSTSTATTSTSGATGGPSRTSLGETQFASAAAKTAAEEAGLVEADFAGQKPSSENGFTKADVTAIADAKA